MAKCLNCGEFIDCRKKGICVCGCKTAVSCAHWGHDKGQIYKNKNGKWEKV